MEETPQASSPDSYPTVPASPLQQEEELQQQQQQQGYCVGIDLGNSTSVVASASPLNHQAVNVEVNRLANRATPSAVAFDGKTRVVGEEAEARLSSLPGSCLQLLASWLAVRSLEEAETIFKRLPFCAKPKVAETPAGLALVVDTQDGEKSIPVVLVLGHFLRCLISFAEAGRRSGGLKTGDKPQVVSVALSQKQIDAAAQQLLLAAAATHLDAGVSLCLLPRTDALLNCWCVRHLPGAFYDLQQQQQQQQQLCIGLVDVGFMESSVHLVRLEQKEEGRIIPNTLSIKINEHLGVAEAITLVCEFVAAEVKRRHGQEVPRHSKKATRLFASCSRAVTHLSGLADSSVDIEGFLENEADLHVPITRQHFEDLCMPLRDSLTSLIAAALGDSGLSPDAIVAVDVVGGGSRIPWVAAAIDEAFADTPQQQQQQQRSKIRRTLDGGSSVAMGAASFAAGGSFVSSLNNDEIRKGLDPQKVQALQEQDVCLGEIETAELRRLEKRNCLEAYLLELQAAARGPHGKSLQRDNIQQLLQQTEHWLLDHEAATETECAAALDKVKETVERECKDYFDAVEKERKQKETDLETHAAAAAAENLNKDDMDVKLPNSQCIKRAKKNKEEANELFRDGNLELAVQRYVKALQYLAKVFDLSPQDKEEAEALRVSLHLNLAQAYLRLSGSNPKAPQHEAFAKKALASCQSALELDSQCVKALYRRAVAYERLKEYTDAMADVKKALQLVPEDADFLKLKDRLEARIKAEKEQQKKIYSKMFS